MASLPRYVPTLTEVVAPQPAVAPRLKPQDRQPADPSVNHDALVQAIIDQLTPGLHLQLRNSAHYLLEMHLREALPALQMSIEAEVRRSVEAALAQRLDDPRS